MKTIAKFEVFEIVEILPSKNISKKYHGLCGVIDRVITDEQNQLIYEVDFAELDESDLITEINLKSTGHFVNRPKFNFNEIVKLNVPKKTLYDVNNSLGRISGRSRSKEDQWSYAVFLFDKGEVWCFDEAELESTGKFAKEEDSYTGERLRVGVTPNGKGEVLGHYAKDGKYTDATDPNFNKIFEKTNENRKTK